MHCTATPTIPSAPSVARSEGQNWCTADSVCVLLLLHIPSKPGLGSACWMQTNLSPTSLSGELLPSPYWTPQSYLKWDLSQSGIFIDLYFTCIK